MQLGNGPYPRGARAQAPLTAGTAPMTSPAAGAGGNGGSFVLAFNRTLPYQAQQEAQAALSASQSLSMFYLGVIQSGRTSGSEQSEYLQLLVQQAGSPQLKSMLQQNQMSQADLVQYLLENPDQLDGLQGQGSSLSVAASLSVSASAPSESASAAASAEFESDGDADLQEFSQDETMAAPSMCAMGGVSSADKAKPEMQQNLKEVKAISAALSEMRQGEDGSDGWLAMVLMQIKGKEQIVRSCLRRGKGAADDAYKAHGIDPKDESSVSAFVAQIGKEVIALGISCGLDIEVSEKRAARLDNRQAGLDKGSAGKGSEGKGGVEKGAKGLQGGSAAEKDEPFEIRTQKTEKHIELGVDEVEANPAMAGAILEQLQALWQQRQADAASFQPPPVLDLGETRQGSPLDQAFGAPQQAAPQSQGGNPQPAGYQAAPAPPAQARPMNAGAISAPGNLMGARPRAASAIRAGSGDLRTLMSLLGMTGQKFSTKIQVYEPNARVVLDRPGRGGVKVNSGLKGKAISVRSPRMVARSADGTLHRVQGVRRVGSGGSFMAVVKGEATGAEAAKQLFTKGDGSISIPGTKAN